MKKFRIDTTIEALKAGIPVVILNDYVVDDVNYRYINGILYKRTKQTAVDIIMEIIPFVPVKIDIKPGDRIGVYSRQRDRNLYTGEIMAMGVCPFHNVPFQDYTPPTIGELGIRIPAKEAYVQHSSTKGFAYNEYNNIVLWAALRDVTHRKPAGNMVSATNTKARPNERSYLGDD